MQLMDFDSFYICDLNFDIFEYFHSKGSTLIFFINFINSKLKYSGTSHSVIHGNGAKHVGGLY